LREGFTMNLNSMSIDRLIGLRSRVEVELGAKVAAERRTLETELSKLSRFPRFQGGAATSKSAFGRTIAPKYRNPENPRETWAGRGLKPRWLSATVRAGKKIDDFRIGEATPPVGQRTADAICTFPAIPDMHRPIMWAIRGAA
jgi:DNA-binding protein H-NS